MSYSQHVMNSNDVSATRKQMWQLPGQTMSFRLQDPFQMSYDQIGHCSGFQLSDGAEHAPHGHLTLYMKQVHSCHQAQNRSAYEDSLHDLTMICQRDAAIGLLAGKTAHHAGTERGFGASTSQSDFYCRSSAKHRHGGSISKVM